jgi:hypothetical protein
VSSAIRVIGKSANPGRTEPKYSRTGISSHRQVSTTEMIAATRGPASLLPTCIQFLRPSATGRIAFSAKLLLNSRTGYSRKRVSRDQSVKARRRGDRSDIDVFLKKVDRIADGKRPALIKHLKCGEQLRWRSRSCLTCPRGSFLFQ